MRACISRSHYGFAELILCDQTHTKTMRIISMSSDLVERKPLHFAALKLFVMNKKGCILTHSCFICKHKV